MDFKCLKLHESSVEIQLGLDEQYNWSVSMQEMFAEEVSRKNLGDAYQFACTELLFDRDTSGPQAIFGA
jgi:hypothetical protein